MPMRYAVSRAALFAIATAAASLPEEAGVTEAAMGRYNHRAFALPGIRILPPIPGVYWQGANVYSTATPARISRYRSAARPRWGRTNGRSRP
ncbi:hypothetical protein ACSBOB_08585 [Mesorhizobium sp. ASY16-5R]|uniref:hypothetical protein n=1 Tax=Mesorhizobium sp. ASY16-5R TaxID=3445772 RepID=UPI003F9EE8C9